MPPATLLLHTSLSLLSPGPELARGLHFVDVGQGSALLLRHDAVTVLVDAGPAAGASALSRALAEQGVDTIDLWIFTHHDADHIGGFAPVIAGLDGRLDTGDDLLVTAIWDRGLAPPLPDSEALALYLALADDRRMVPDPGARFERAGLRIEVLALDPPPATAPENDRGLSLCVELDGLRALLPGDASAERVELAAAACPSVDVLWLSHHGGATSSSSAGIELADPGVVVISAGHANAYCHPSPLALSLSSSRTTWILDGAGFDPRGPCPPAAELLSPSQRWLAGDLWLDANDRTAWVGEVGGWTPLH